MNNISEIWSLLARRSSASRREKIPKLRDFLRGINNPHAILLSGGIPRSVADETSARLLEESVISHYRNNSKFSKIDAADWLSLCSAAVTEFNKSNKIAAQIWVTPSVTPVPSIFNPTAMIASQSVDLWRQALHTWIINNSTTASRQEFQAATLLSAILHGMLTDSTKVKRLLGYLSNNTEPDIELSLPSLPFKLAFEGLGDYHLQRWQLDPITEMLYWRTLNKEGNDLDASGLYDACKQILITHGVDRSRLPNTLVKLIRAVTTWWSCRTSQIDIQSETRTFQSHAVHERSWQRLTRVRSNVQNPKVWRSSNEVDLPRQISSDETSPDDMRLLFPWFGELLSELEADETGNSIRSYLSQPENKTPDPTIALYFDWLRWHLDGHSSSGGPITIKTILKRFSVTASRFLSIFGSDNPVALNTLELEDVYAELTSDPNPAIPIKALREGIRDFHAFLVKTHGHPKIDRESEILGNDSSLKPVDANIISFDEYEKAYQLLKSRLTKRKVSIEEVEICQIVLMLAFRAGMRRMEIFGLLLSDIQTHLELTLDIHPHKDRKLKTTNATRIIPIGAFLPMQERLLLRNFVAQRYASIEQSPKQNNFLFHQFGTKKYKTWISRIYNLVRDAIREATGDQNLYLHHLRHSFASWTYLRLQTPDFPELAEQFSHLPKTKKALERGRRLRVHLLHKNPCTSKNYGFAVARLLGHSSPAVTFSHYIHCCDLLIGAKVRREANTLDKQVFIAASGFAKSTAYDNHKTGLQPLLNTVRTRFRKQTPEIDSSNPKRRGAPRKEESDLVVEHWIPFQIQLDILKMYVKPSVTETTIGEALSISPKKIRTTIESVYSHGRHLGIIGKDKLISSSPSAPIRQDDYAFFSKIEVKLRRLFATNPVLFNKGIELHLSRVVAQKNDVLFEGKNEFQQLKAYLKFLKALGIEGSELKWVLRLNGPAKFPPWCDTQRLPMLPTTVKVISPPDQAKADKYANSIGVLTLSATKETGIGKLFNTALTLAATAAYSRNQTNKEI